MDIFLFSIFVYLFMMKFIVIKVLKLIKNLSAYAVLARWDKPIGMILLMLPCWWGIALATPPFHYPNPFLLWIFAWGAFFMRSAGCTYNDYIDRDIDRQVVRTASRPLAAKTIKTKNAFYFLLIQLFLGALIFPAWPRLSFRRATIPPLGIVRRSGEHPLAVLHVGRFLRG